jgi:hypothetical protein
MWALAGSRRSTLSGVIAREAAAGVCADVATARRRVRSRRVAGAKWRSGLVEIVFIGSFLT